MENLFSIGELAKYQNISKQTLIFYDKTGLFKPAYVDPDNGYRYYSADQIDYLDAILIMKKIGFPLSEIKKHMKSYNIENSLTFLRNQLSVIENQISELNLIKSRLAHRCSQMENAIPHIGRNPEIILMPEQYILCHNVDEPYGMKEISLATKKCFAESFEKNLPVFFQCGVSVPLAHIALGEFTKADTAFITTDYTDSTPDIKVIPEGYAACIYHYGDYYSIGRSYQELLEFCIQKKLNIISDSYEFCINDYITSKDENEYITKIIFYIEQKA